MNSSRDNGWDASAARWIAHMGERGDWGRQHVLDKVMLERVAMQPYKSMLDVGCGEGRFCRALTARGITTTGIDPARDLIARAITLHVSGNYQVARAEALPFPTDSFDLVVSYLTLIDIADFRAGLGEMVRVLKPNGRLLIANLNSFVTSCPRGWIRDRTASFCITPSISIWKNFRRGSSGRTSASRTGIDRCRPTCRNCSDWA
jgi:ubiquinone/menaquinone biosynthesis C-methylase UbiE